MKQSDVEKNKMLPGKMKDDISGQERKKKRHTYQLPVHILINALRILCLANYEE